MDYIRFQVDNKTNFTSLLGLLDYIKNEKIAVICWHDYVEVEKLLYKSGAKIEFVQSEIELRNNFNPLKRQQDIIIKHNKTVYFVPYLILKYNKDIECAWNISKGLNLEQKDIFYNLLGYGITKNLKYFTAIIKSGFPLDLDVFKELSPAIGENGVNLERFEKIAKMLSGESTCGQLVHKLRHVRNCERKNVIFLHLESISNEIYYNNLECFPNLSALMSRALHLKNFYSTASSSAMTLMDLFYGNDFENDRFAVFEEMRAEGLYGIHLFEILHNNGYEILGAGCNENVEEMNRFGMWDFHEKPYEWTGDFDGFMERVKGFAESASRPFAMHLWNVLPHIGHNNDEIRMGKGYSERMRRSYKYLDIMIKVLIETLEKLNILDNTIIIGYGDHGDDKWTRSMNSGFTHITAPYLNLVKTPAFIYDSRIDSKMFTGIVSTIDLKYTALYLAGIENDEKFLYKGINIFENENDFVFSRSLLTNQRETEKLQADWIIRLNNNSDTEKKTKSFNIIGRDYNLIVSSDGMEFFMHSTDPGNYNNLLDFLEIDESGEIIKFNNHGAWRGHFRAIVMEDDQIYHSMCCYYEMRKRLMDRIEVKNAMIDWNERNPFDMKSFDKSRKRGFLW